MYIPNISVAEIKTYTHTVKQRFGGSQSADDARVAAIARAKREILERAGTYLESLTIIKNHLVGKDEVQILAAGVLKTEVVSEKRYASNDLKVAARLGDKGAQKFLEYKGERY